MLLAGQCPAVGCCPVFIDSLPPMLPALNIHYQLPEYTMDQHLQGPQLQEPYLFTLPEPTALFGRACTLASMGRAAELYQFPPLGLMATLPIIDCYYNHCLIAINQACLSPELIAALKFQGNINDDRDIIYRSQQWRT